MNGFGVGDRLVAGGVFIGLVVDLKNRIGARFAGEYLSMSIEQRFWLERFAAVVEFQVVAVDDLVGGLARGLG